MRALARWDQKLKDYPFNKIHNYTIKRESIEAMTGYVSSVEFTDGSLWIPTRGDLANPRLQKIAAPSAEEQRLVQLYRRKGLNALIEEVKKF